MTGRRYIKRIWRVPKDRGAREYLATLCCKALRKHGWPADYKPEPFTEGFRIFSKDHGENPQDAPEDFLAAVEVCVRIMARTYSIDVAEHRGFVEFLRDYAVLPRGGFKEIKG